MTNKYSADDATVTIKDVRMLAAMNTRVVNRDSLVADVLRTKENLYVARAVLHSRNEKRNKEEVFERNEAYLEAMRRLEDYDSPFRSLEINVRCE